MHKDLSMKFSDSHDSKKYNEPAQQTRVYRDIFTRHLIGDDSYPQERKFENLAIFVKTKMIDDPSGQSNQSLETGTVPLTQVHPRSSIL
jgi:hypothetical protein